MNNTEYEKLTNVYGEERNSPKFDGALLLENRLHIKKTQKEIANLLKIDYQQYQRWEYGDSVPSADNLMKLAIVLDISLQDLYN